MKVGDRVTVTIRGVGRPANGSEPIRVRGVVDRLNGSQVRVQIDGVAVWVARERVELVVESIDVLSNFMRAGKR